MALVAIATARRGSWWAAVPRRSRSGAAIVLDFVDPFDVPPAAAAPPVDTRPVAEAINRATAEQTRANREAENCDRQANQAAERGARRDRYGY